MANFMVAVTIFYDFGTQENKMATIFTFSSSIFCEVMHWMPWSYILSFKPAFSLSSFTFI